MTYEHLIGPHVEQTREAMAKSERVLLIQDTTEVDYQQHPTTTGLGPIGNGTHHGYLLQSVLAVRPDTRQVVGLAHQKPFLRQPARHLEKPSGSASSANGNEPRVGTQCPGHRRTPSRRARDPRGRPLQ